MPNMSAILIWTAAEFSAGLQEWRRGEGAPMFEALVGVPCQTGLLDGPLALAACLLGGDPQSDVHACALEAGKSPDL